jgi:hypothetical protein
MAKTNLKLVTPATKKRAVTPRRRPNSEFRSREHLTESEVEKLIEAAKDKTLAPPFAVTLLYPGIGAGVTDKLWGIGDIVKVLKDWEKRR